MKRHSKHHTAKHMKYMKRRMLMGDTFRQAHKKSTKYDKGLPITFVHIWNKVSALPPGQAAKRSVMDRFNMASKHHVDILGIFSPIRPDTSRRLTLA